MTRPLLLLAFFLTTIKLDALACDCDGTPTFDTEFKGSDRVFVGQVISIKPYHAQKGRKLFSEFVIEFTIDKVYKGTTTKNVKVRTPVSIASCGYPFEKGEKYLVYTFRSHNASNVSYCSRTNEINLAAKDVEKLKKLSITDKTATNIAFVLSGLRNIAHQHL